MKTKLIGATILAAISISPFASNASDTEVANPAFGRSCRNTRQIAVFVSGHGIGEEAEPRMQTVQVGQGTPITFYTR